MSRSIAAVVRRRRREGASVPTVALQFDGEFWCVNENNTEAPDGYYVIDGDNLFIDPDATSGAPISVVDGNIFIGT